MAAVSHGGEEAKRTLAKLGDKMPIILKTWARGIGGVKTKLNSRKVIAKIRELYRANPLEFNFVQKWVQLIIGVTLNSNR